MAQWNGQFTGNTHSTKVADCEDALRSAVKAFKASSNEQLVKKGKSVRNLAGKLLTARSKLVRAKLVQVKPVTTPNTNAVEVELKHLAEREEEIIRGGLVAILEEFGVPELGRN